MNKKHCPFKIIIIEDDKGLNRLISKNLEKEGLETVSVFNGQEALDQIDEQRDEIILVDYKLPDMSAKELISKLKEKGLETPFVVITGHGDEQTAVEMMKMGARDYISKQDNFIELLRHHLSKVCAEIEKDKKLERYQEDLKKSNERYQNFISQSSEGIYRLEMEEPMATSLSVEEQIDHIFDNANIAECNDAFRKMYNIPLKRDIINEKLIDFHKKRNDPINRSFVRDFIRYNYHIENIETKEKTENGETIWFSNNMIGIVEDGKLIRMWGTQLEITEQKRAQEALRKSEEKYRSIFENSALGIFRSTPEGRYQEVNEAFANILGFDCPQKMIDDVTDISQLYKYPEDREKIKKEFASKGFVEDYEVVGNHPHKDTVWISINAKQQQAPDGQIYYEGTIQDITERKLAEIQRKKSETKYKTLFESVPNGITVSDKKGKIIEANKEAARILGLSEKEHTRRKIDGEEWKIIRPDGTLMPAEEFASTRALKENQRVENVEMGIVKDEDDIRWIIVSAIPVPIENLGVLISYRDITERIKVEEELRSKSKAIAASMDGIAILNKDEEYVYLNQAHAETYGYPDPSELLGKTWRLLYDDEELKRFENEIMPRFFKQGNWRGEAVGKKKDGTKFPQEISLTGLKDGGLICIVRDITGRKKIEKSLKESENKYRSLVNQAAEMLFLHDLDGNIIEVNKAAVETTGLTREKLLNINVTTLAENIIKQEDIKKVWNELTPKTGHKTIEADLIEGIGAIFEIRMSKVVIDNCEYILALARDITERKQREKEYKQLINGMSDTSFVVDFDGSFVDVNETTVQVLGYSRQELLNMGPVDINPEHDSEKVQEIMEKLKKGESVRFETKHQTKEGKIYPVDVSLSPVTYKGKDAIFNISRDITDRKKAEQEKEKLQKQLLQTQKLESIGTLAGGVAHDFNNILTVIIGLSQLVLTRTKRSDPNYDKLESILNSAERAAELTKQLLLFSRKEEMDLEIIDLNKTISGLRMMLNRLIGEDITMHNDLNHDLWQVNADKNQMEQVITNLTVNARDAMPGGGDLTISTNNVIIDHEKAQNIPDIKPGEYICLSIEDTGSGIEKSLQKKIFDPFFTTKGRAEGTGMGLSVVHGIVKKHGGVINVYSEPGEGTIFKIYLPAVIEKEIEMSEEQESESFENYKGSGETILLVEDEKPVLTYLESILDNYGYHYLSAKSAEKAVQLFKENEDNIDLLISDVILTGMDGMQLANKLKSEKVDLKVILSSGYSNKKVKMSSIKEKGYNFIQKPYNIMDLLKTIHKTLNPKDS